MLPSVLQALPLECISCCQFYVVKPMASTPLELLHRPTYRPPSWGLRRQSSWCWVVMFRYSRPWLLTTDTAIRHDTPGASVSEYEWRFSAESSTNYPWAIQPDEPQGSQEFHPELQNPQLPGWKLFGICCRQQEFLRHLRGPPALAGDSLCEIIHCQVAELSCMCQERGFDPLYPTLEHNLIWHMYLLCAPAHMVLREFA